MTDMPPPTLPLLAALEALDAWHKAPTAKHRSAVRDALTRVIHACGAAGAYLRVEAAPLPGLNVALGSVRRVPSARSSERLARHELELSDRRRRLGTIWLDTAGATDPGTSAGNAARAVAMALDAAWSRAEAGAAAQRGAALDAAVRGVASVLSVDRVLQLIVDRVRELVSAQYAALGIVGPQGGMERFITSGVTPEQRAQIGPPPKGHGLLGLIIRKDRSILIDDIAADHRRAGFPPNHPEMHSFLGVPVRSQGRTTGNLYLTNKQTARTFNTDDQQLVEVFALHAGIAIHNARLHEQVRQLAVVEDRNRIGQDLHDGIIQSLYAVALSLEDAVDRLADDPAHAQQTIDRSIDSIHQTIRDIRNFILGLRPELLGEVDLGTGIRTLATEFQVNSMIDLEVRLTDPMPELASEAAAHLVAMTREGLSNIARHSAASRATLELLVEDGTLTLVIGDNGRGFDPLQPPGGGHGLGNLQSRAAALGGTLLVRSEPGAGTRLEARMPASTNSQMEAAQDG